MLDVGFVLLVEAFEQVGTNRIDAIERANALGVPTVEQMAVLGIEPPARPAKKKTEAEIVAENNMALSLIQQMLSGTDKGQAGV
jgi:hypothetical protein